MKARAVATCSGAIPPSPTAAATSTTGGSSDLPPDGESGGDVAPSAVETPTGYRLFYGGWDGVATGNDLIYSLNTDFAFQSFSNRHSVILPGSYIHVNNVNALRFDDGSYAMHATLYPVTNLNKPVFIKSDPTGTNWSGRTGEPYTARTSNLVSITGYNYAAADINGMNVMLYENGTSLLGASPTLRLQTAQTYQLQFANTPIPLKIQRVGNDVVLNWTNPVFSLQSSLVITGAFAVISNSTSPYTNPATGTAKYFRLRAP